MNPISLRKQFIALFAVLLLTGCAPAVPTAPSAAATEAPTAAVTEQAQAPAVDLAGLPRDVDVQTAADLAQRPDVVILDVREQNEWDAGHIPGAVLIPMSEIQGRLSEVPKDKTVIVQCRSGNRSSQVTDFLQQQGFTNVHNLSGGLNAWQAASLPVVK